MCVCVVCLLRTVTVQPAISTSLPHTQGLLSGSMRSASYSIRRGSDLESSGGSKPAPSALAGSGKRAGANRQPASGGFGSNPRFQYLDHNYSLETPSCLIPQINELFKSACERYDIAVTNREKVDEALQLFKKVLEVDPSLPVANCFATWKSQLTNPKFTVERYDRSGDVKRISVRAEEVPRLKRKAQKHIRDLLDACHLFLQQKDFLKREIRNSLEELDKLTRNLPALVKSVSLSSSERKNMPQVVKQAREQFVRFPDTLDLFWVQVSGLLQEINTAIHILEEDDTE
jgi:tetratricopeptide (TPR) repeat protein